MANWYMKGQSEYIAANFHMALYIDHNGFPEADYDTRDIESHGETSDPFMAFGIDTGPATWTFGQQQVEIGLLKSHRLKFDTTGAYKWVGPGQDDWELLGAGGGGNLGDLDDVVIDGTPADNELLSWDNGSSKWINQTAAETGLAVSGHNHAHNDLTGLNDGVDYEHITQTQKDALHAIYTLEQHDNNYHSTNYHTEADGTGVVTVHSDVTDVGSGAIITTGERNALHPQSHALDSHTTPSGSIPMNSQKFTGLTDGTASADSMAFGQKFTNANAVSAVATADDYLKNDVADATTGDLTVPNLICAGLVDGKDVSGLCTADEARDGLNGEYFSFTEGLFGQRYLRVPYLNNILYSADKRFTIIKTGNTITYTPAGLFNGNLSDYPLTIADGEVVTLNFDLIDKSEWTGDGLTYPYGKLYIHVYHTYHLGSVRARLYTKNGDGSHSWRDWRNGVDISISGSYNFWEITFSGNYHCQEMEIEFTANGTDAWICELEWVINRGLDYRVYPLLRKYSANNVYGDLVFKDSSNVTKLSLTTSGIVMGTNKITGLGDGSSAQDAMAFGQKYTLEQHDNAYHTTNYHSESDGTGVVTIHSDVSDSGSGSIITLVERGKIHDKQHVITSTTDHTSTATSGKILKADANGLPIDATNTDTEVASAVTLKHNEAHVLATTGPHTGDLPITDIATGTDGYRLRAGTPNTWAETVSNLAYDGISWDNVTDIAPSKGAVRDVIDPLLSSLKYSGAWTAGTDKYPEAQTDGTVGSTVGTSVFTDTTKDFTSLGVLVGDILNIREGVDEGFYVIDVVGTTTVTCTGDTFGTVSNLEYQIFRAVGGEYWICDAYGEYDSIWYEVGDWLIWNDTEIQWDRIRNSFGDNLIYVSTSGSIQNAIDELASKGGGKIVLAAGSHTVSTELTINNVDVELFIEGSGINTSLVLGATNNGFNITNCKFLSLRNFEIDITAFTSINVGIIVNETNNNKIEIYGINIIGDNVLNGYGIELKSHNVKIDNCYIYKTYVGIRLAFGDSSSINTVISNSNIVECYVCVDTSGGGYGSYTKIIANNFTDYTYRGVMLTDTIYTIISNNHFKTVNTAANAIYSITPPSWNLIIGNVIDGGNYAVVAGSGAVISNNIITNMSICDVIYLFSNSTCSNNIIYNCDENSTLTIGVIHIGGDYNVCNGNTIYNCSNAGSGVCHPILIGSGCDYNIIGPNVFYNNENNTVNDSGTGTKIFGDDTAYNATSWDGDLGTATKNAIRDKFESLGGCAYHSKTSQRSLGTTYTSSLEYQMNGAGDYCRFKWRLQADGDWTQDCYIKITYYETGTGVVRLNHFIGATKTNNTEILAWNIENGTTRNYTYNTPLKTMTITIANAGVDLDDLLSFHMTYNTYYGSSRDVRIVNVELLYKPAIS